MSEKTYKGKRTGLNIAIGGLCLMAGSFIGLVASSAPSNKNVAGMSDRIRGLQHIVYSMEELGLREAESFKSKLRNEISDIKNSKEYVEYSKKIEDSVPYWNASVAGILLGMITVVAGTIYDQKKMNKLGELK